MGCSSSREAASPSPVGKRYRRDIKARNSTRVDDGAQPTQTRPPISTEPHRTNHAAASGYSVGRDTRTSVNATITTMVQARRLDLWDNDSDLASQPDQAIFMEALAPPLTTAHQSPIFSLYGADMPPEAQPGNSGDEELLEMVPAADSTSDHNYVAQLPPHPVDNSAPGCDLPPSSTYLTMGAIATHDAGCSTVVQTWTPAGLRQWRTDVAAAGKLMPIEAGEAPQL